MDKIKFSNEQIHVASEFKKNFLQYANHDIILYGIGKNTAAILSMVEGFHFVGLMDASTEGQTKYQFRVLSVEEVINDYSNAIIVIIARFSVVDIIYKRIERLHKENGILIFNLNGELLGQQDYKYQNETLDYWLKSEEILWKEIEKYDVISFDIFDTLLMRKVLEPTDVFKLIEIRLLDKGYDIEFKENRIRAEKDLQGRYPDLDDIYIKLQENIGITSELANEIKTMEYSLDSELIIPRTCMCEIFQRCLDNNKAVYLISDMYYSKEFIKGLLSKNGIEGYKDLYVSSDIKMEKSTGELFCWFKDRMHEKTILHIGDNRYSDIEKANLCGINTFHIYSSYEILMASSMQTIASDLRSFRKKCILGVLISKIFNNPFALFGKSGWVVIESISTLAYCFVAPFVYEITRWIHSIVKNGDYDQVLFPSRDGFLFYSLFQYCFPAEAEKTIYFRTSRRATTVAAIFNEMDIKRIAKRRYQGLFSNFLFNRFGVNVNSKKDFQISSTDEIDNMKMMSELSVYNEIIIRNSEKERKAYKKYLEDIGIDINDSSKKRVLFDFVAGGTVQNNLERIIKGELKGVYVATMNLPNDMYQIENESIISAYGNITSYGENCNLSKSYLFFEPLLSDGYKSFSHIDENGEIVFCEDSTSCNMEDVNIIKEMVLQYAKELRVFIDIGVTPELNIINELIGFLFSDKCKRNQDIFKKFKNEDIFDGIREFTLFN